MVSEVLDKFCIGCGHSVLFYHTTVKYYGKIGKAYCSTKLGSTRDLSITRYTGGKQALLLRVQGAGI